MEHYDYDESCYAETHRHVSVIEGFLKMPLSMQYGVYVDWFDSVGISIAVHPNNNSGYSFCIGCENYPEMTGFKDRTDARKEALEMANETFNLKMAGILI